MDKGFFRHLYHYFIIYRSGLFDNAYYLLTNPDVRKADINPLWHFVRFGWKEFRNPSAEMNLRYYLRNNPDVEAAGINPLIHFIRHGQRENRIINKKTGEKEDNKIVKQIFNRPEISIIIPVYNALKYTKNCIRHVYKYQDETKFEVIVIDNASEPNTQDWLKSASKNYPNLKCKFLEKNLGFAPAVNIGIQQSVGEYIVILNSDTIPTPNWLKHLRTAFDKDDTLGIVSPLTNYVGEGHQVDLHAINLKPSKIESYARSIASQTKILYDPKRLVFFCVMFRRSLVDRIGFLDESYIRGNFEDDDYSLRTRIAGFNLGIIQNAFVFHHGSASFKENNLSYSQYFNQNKKNFFLKVSRISSSLSTKTSKRSEMEPPEVSVVVRTVNRPDLLRCALNSLVNQTYRNFEVVLINDGGPNLNDVLDNYREILNLTYIKNPTSKGRTASLNIGCESSAGSWIAFLDDDDIYYPWHLEMMLSSRDQSESYNFLYGMFNYGLIYNMRGHDPIDIGLMSCFNYSHNDLLLGNRIPINTWFISKHLIEEVGGFDETFDTLEDYDFALKASSFQPFKVVGNVIAEYRIYLPITNTLPNSRRDSYQALKRIYERYPVSSEKLNSRRAKILKDLSIQADRIEELTNMLQVADENEKTMIYKKILNVIGIMHHF